MKYILIRAVVWFGDLIILALCIRALLSWFGQNPYSTAGKAYQVFVRITEPVVAPCRNLLYRFNTGMFDFSVFLAFILVQIIVRVLTMIISLIF